MGAAVVRLVKQTVSGFIADDALSHGAAIAYYTVFSIAPVLVIAIAVAGLGLILALGFVLMVSLAVSAGLVALEAYLNGLVTGFHVLVQSLSFGCSLLLVAGLLAAIYKYLPDTRVAWKDVMVGAMVTALL